MPVKPSLRISLRISQFLNEPHLPELRQEIAGEIASQRQKKETIQPIEAGVFIRL
jgi:hypothetical protein